MKIKIKDDKTNLNLWLPNHLLFSKHLWKFIMKRKDSDKSEDDDNFAFLVENPKVKPQDLKEIKNSLAYMKKRHPEMPLVEVHSVDGESVLIMP